MTNNQINILLQTAIKFFNGGEYENAKASLNIVLKIQPNNFDALQIKGVLYGIENNHDKALVLFKKALKINPNNSFINFNVAKALSELGDNLGAIKYHLAATRISPKHAEAWLNFANSYSKLKRFDEALDNYDQAINLKLDYLEAWMNKGLALTELKRFEEALIHYDKSIELRSDYAEAWMRKGLALSNLRRFDEALINYDQAINLKIDYLEAWMNKGLALAELRRFDEALIYYDKSIELKSNYAEAWMSKGLALVELGRHDEALIYYDKSIELKSNYAEAWMNKGLALVEIGRFDEAFDCYDQAILLRAELFEARLNKAILNLYLKKFKYGFQQYEVRLKNLSIFGYELSEEFEKVSDWDGAKKCSHLLVKSEQGIGDEIFYASMLFEVQSKVDKVSVILDKRLIPIFSRSFPGIMFYEKNHVFNDSLFDAQLPMGSLPYILNKESTNNRSFGYTYLVDNVFLTNELKKSDCFKDKFTCGISWKSSNKKLGNQKSMELLDMKRIFEIPGCEFINLQYGDVHNEIEYVKNVTNVDIKSIENVDNYTNIDGLLSTISACDVVVTTSNVTAHLAGAIGKKTFLLLPSIQGKIWYWHDEKVSSWYPSIKQYYQDAEFSWDKAINEIVNQLKDEIDGKN